MDCIIDIYLFQNQYIFTGALELFFEKYKGIGPGTYSKPILVYVRRSKGDGCKKAGLFSACSLHLTGPSPSSRTADTAFNKKLSFTFHYLWYNRKSKVISAVSVDFD